MDVTMLANGMILSGFVSVALIGGIIYLTRDQKKTAVDDIDDNHMRQVKNVLAKSDVINRSKVPGGKCSAIYTQIATIGDINSNRNKKRKKRK